MTTEHPFIKFCADRGVTIVATQFTPSPADVRGNNWKLASFAWRVQLRLGGRTLRTVYWCGRGHSKIINGVLTPTPPSAPDVLVALLLDAQSVEGRTFEEWCGDLGQEEDSIKALATYKACKKGSLRLQRLLGSETAVAEFVEASRDW